MSLKSVFAFALSILSSFISLAQEGSSNDSVKVLNEIVVQAFATDRPLNEVAAAVSFLNQKNLERFNNTSLLPAVNTIPGVRMEERSPGSYRFSLRGSLLRSPFGVRNVKMYWNGLPLTDGGGNTYINLLDFNSVTSMEIIKGPGASLYGAGTGGVVLLNSNLSSQNQVNLSFTGGDYGLKRYLISTTVGSEKIRARVQYARQESDGYRDHTAMQRDILNTDVAFKVNDKSTLGATLFYSDLFYETPGGLTKAEYNKDPRHARPGADTVKASVSNETFYGGLSYDYQWNENWSTVIGFFGSTTEFANPTFRNYEQRSEDNFGGRLINHYKFDKDTWKGKITFGGEHQQFKSPVLVTSKKSGMPGPVVFSDDDLSSTQTLLFVQAEFDLPSDFILTAGLSSTFLKYDLDRFQPDSSTLERNFDPVISPRIALLKKFGSYLSFYATVSSGFSPPSLAEVRPSTNEFNDTLNPEHGINIEVGLKGQLGSFNYELNRFWFDLEETIVIQRTPDGADYFVNAGSTTQQGIELQLRWSPRFNTNNLELSVFGSYTLNSFYFDDYVSGGEDFSGNRLTGVAPNVIVIGGDVVVLSKLYLNATMNYTDHIPLNDANSEFAQEYYLFGLRAGYKALAKTRYPLEFFVGVDNLSDRKYSLGNDLNAQPVSTPRFYNVAAGRNFYFGLKANALFGKLK